MGVSEAIIHADSLLPGEPVEDGEDPRWQAIIKVGEHIESEPEAVWAFILRWGVFPQSDLRAAIACCLLEHLLEHHFSTYFSRVELHALADPFFGDTFMRCSRFGHSDEADNADLFERLQQRLLERRGGGVE